MTASTGQIHRGVRRHLAAGADCQAAGQAPLDLAARAGQTAAQAVEPEDAVTVCHVPEGGPSS
jgi:hypothetical protein